MASGNYPFAEHLHHRSTSRQSRQVDTTAHAYRACVSTFWRKRLWEFRLQLHFRDSVRDSLEPLEPREGVGMCGRQRGFSGSSLDSEVPAENVFFGCEQDRYYPVGTETTSVNRNFNARCATHSQTLHTAFTLHSTLLPAPSMAAQVLRHPLYKLKT